MVPGQLVLAADEDSHGVTIWLVLLSKSGLPTVAEGQLDVSMGEGRCLRLARRVSLDDFTIERSGPVYPVLVLSHLSLRGTPCAAGSRLSITVRFRPRRSPRAVFARNELYGCIFINRPSPQAPTAPRPAVLPALSHDDSPIQRVVTEHLHELHSCYERQLVRQPELAGKLVAEWTITRSGLPVGVRARSSTLGSPLLESCILSAIGRWRFPRRGRPILVGYPFYLSPTPF